RIGQPCVRVDYKLEIRLQEPPGSDLVQIRCLDDGLVALHTRRSTGGAQSIICKLLKTRIYAEIGYSYPQGVVIAPFDRPFPIKARVYVPVAEADSGWGSHYHQEG